MGVYKVFKGNAGKSPKQTIYTPEYEQLDDVLCGLFSISQRKDGGKNNNVKFATRFNIEASCTFGDTIIAKTCPAGKRMYISFLCFSIYQSGASARNNSVIQLNTFNGNLEVCEVYTYTQRETKTLIIAPPQGIVLEAGESIQIFSDNETEVRISGFGYQIDAL